MEKRSDKTNTGEGGKGKKGKTVSDDTGGKSLSDTSTSAGVKSTVIRTSVIIFESSKRDKSQYFVDKVKDKRRTKNNNLEFLIGCRGFPDPKDDTWETLGHLSGSEHMIREFNEQWEKDYVRKPAETLEAQTVRRKRAAEQNDQREDIDEAMGEGAGDEEEDGESEDGLHHTHTHTTYSLTDTPIHIHFPLCLTHQYIRSTVTLSTPHTWSYLTNDQPS
jgi:hypothetical protein